MKTFDIVYSNTVIALKLILKFTIFLFKNLLMIFFLSLIFFMLSMFVRAEPKRVIQLPRSGVFLITEAKADNMEGWEDYSTEIGKPLNSHSYEFGDTLLSSIREYFAPKLIKMHHHSAYQEKVYNRMYWRHSSMDMLTTFKGEGGLVKIDQPSNGVGWDGKRAYGFCQLYETYHRDFINSPDFMDWRKQVDYCVEVYKKAERAGSLNTTFQAYPKRHNKKKFFEVL